MNAASKIDLKDIDELLEKEKVRNKGEDWIKLDKTIRRQKLQEYADKYGKENNMNSKEIKVLNAFFNNCLEKNKLNKSKDVVYNKDDRIITSIPALHFNQVTKNFTLKIMDAKRVSTLKSLTPKRHIPENTDIDMQKEKID